MIRISTLLACLLLSFILPAQNYQLRLQSGTLNTIENTAVFAKAESPKDVVGGYYYRMLQFNNIPDQITTARIKSEGIILLNYLPVNTYAAAIPVNFDRHKLVSFGVRSVIELLDVQKISTPILGSFPAYCINEKGTADVTIQYYANLPHDHALQLASSVGKIISSNAANHVIHIRISDNSLYALAAHNWVYYIAAITAPSFPEDTKARSLHRTNVINSAFTTGRKYDGSGVVAALGDDGFVGPHIDFTGRLFNFATGIGQSHGDMTSGILIGGGNLNPEYRGMGSGAFLYVYNISNYPHIIDAVNNYNTLGTVITSTSYSQGCNEYTSDTEFGDDLLNNNRQLSFVFSAGNNQSADCNYGAGAGWGNITGGYKQGKNVIACGNLNPLEVLDATSSRGPASDGRIKPDICSNGADQMSTNENNTYQVGGGTSAASPGIAGILTELYQAYKELNGGVEPQAALMKACLLNGAEDIGNAGPDYTYGWGRVNALRAIQTIEENRYLHDSIIQGQNNNHQIVVPAGTTELRVMVYWNDKAGTPLAATQLVNDLNITLTDTGGVSFNPWVLDETPTVAAITTPAIRGIDNLNNIEQVTIENPVIGIYTLTVNGFSIPFGPQDYYVVYEFRNNNITLTYPFGGEAFAPGVQEVIRWDSKKGLGTYTLQYSMDNGTNWNTINSSVGQNVQQFSWNVPSNLTPTHEALFRVLRGADSDVSDTTFRIIGIPQNLQIAWVCPDSLKLTWSNVSGATGYTIYQLGTKYMDPIGTSVTNSFVVPNINPQTEHWFSVAAQINGFDGRRALAIHQTPGTINCPLSTDASVTAIASPAPGQIRDCNDNSALTVTIEFQNTGMNPVSNIPVSYRVNNGTLVNEVIAGPVQPGSQTTYTFTSTVNLSATGNYTIQVWSSLTGDQNLYNDTVTSITTVVSSVLQVFPTSENFDSYVSCSAASDCEFTTCSTGVKWVNETNGVDDDIDFRVFAGATPSASTGPDADHTLGTPNSKYIYLETSGTCSARLAVLTAACVDLTSATQPQLSFWYHMYGATMGTLTVDIYSDGAWTNNVFPVISGNQGNQWNQGIVNLSAYAGKIIDVRFRAVTGSDYTSDLALDDISITNATSIEESVVYNDIRIYPNPSSGVFHIESTNQKSESITIDVTDAQGRILRNDKIVLSPGIKHTVDLQKESRGIYFIRLNGEEGTKTVRVTVL